jgi:nucleoid-associated protein YgaU
LRPRHPLAGIGFRATRSRNGYRDGSKYQEIANASGISNAALINPGQVLTVP